MLKDSEFVKEKSCSKDNLSQYIQEILDILSRWLKIMAQDEKSIVSAIIVEKLIKGLVMKMDQAFVFRKQNFDDYKVETDDRIKMIQENIDSKIAMIQRRNVIEKEFLHRNLLEVENRTQDLKQTISDLNKSLLSKNKQIYELVSPEGIEENFNELQRSFYEM
jgi:hypothetical protein